ncbi:MAG: hypothetical protein LUQ66_07535 [Methanoregula sp.]|nr:hypothetical protein [Methanoregula sp.]
MPKNIREIVPDLLAFRVHGSRKIPACFSYDECGRIVPVPEQVNGSPAVTGRA